MNKKTNKNEIIISRVIIMLFAYFLLSVLTMIYIIPFKKHYLLINNHYKIIEYCVIGITFALSVFTVMNSIVNKKRSVDFSNKLITPSMMNLVVVPAFVASVIIPLSNNRTIIYKFAIVLFAVIFVAYFVYNIISKSFCYNVVICGINIMILLLLDTFYSGTITFNDKLSLGYNTALMLSGLVSLIIILISYLISKRISTLKLWQSLMFCIFMLLSLICRVFIFEYVVLIAVCIHIIALLILSYLEYKK